MSLTNAKLVIRVGNQLFDAERIKAISEQYEKTGFFSFKRKNRYTRVSMHSGGEVCLPIILAAPIVQAFVRAKALLPSYVNGRVPDTTRTVFEILPVYANADNEIGPDEAQTESFRETGAIDNGNPSFRGFSVFQSQQNGL